MTWNFEITGDIYLLTTGRIRSNSAISDHSWVAEITGLGGPYGLLRSFVSRSKSQYGNHDGEQSFGPLSEGKVYEYRAIWDGSSAHQYRKGTGQVDGFFRIDEHGAEIKMTKAEAIAFLQSQAHAIAK